MQKPVPIVFLALILTLSGCSFVVEMTPMMVSVGPTHTHEILRFTDEEIEALVSRHPFLRSDGYGPPSPEGALDQLGINLEILELIDRRIGDCFDEMIYDISPSYLLVIDNNTCFGTRVRIGIKE